LKVIQFSKLKTVQVNAQNYLISNSYKLIISFRWNNRPYYWDSSYYKSNKYGSHMCHVHVDPNDEDLGKVYFQDGTRPKELVWSCNYDEYCCGYECCN
uniref:CX domain-containing protein n=1 Tax=Thelazia callipaeda TaxID=103827 RepID=A0A0N5DB61_THECL